MLPRCKVGSTTRTPFGDRVRASNIATRTYLLSAVYIPAVVLKYRRRCLLPGIDCTAAALRFAWLAGCKDLNTKPVCYTYTGLKCAAITCSSRPSLHIAAEMHTWYYCNLINDSAVLGEAIEIRAQGFASWGASQGCILPACCNMSRALRVRTRRISHVKDRTKQARKKKHESFNLYEYERTSRQKMFMFLVHAQILQRLRRPRQLSQSLTRHTVMQDHGHSLAWFKARHPRKKQVEGNLVWIPEAFGCAQAWGVAERLD